MVTDHSRLRDLFIAACDLPAPQQIALMDEQCSDDPKLRFELEQLLRQDGSTDGILADAGLTAGLQLDFDTLLEVELPEKIGCYCVKRVLGQGGMGIVYLAQQENPQRDVAVKVIRPGVMNRELIRRFEFEAAVLGRLKHPGIARIHEAGMYEDGSGRRPFFAMDYIDGQPLNEYIRQRNPSVPDRLQMFAQICNAVHHAHQRGVIHRDLKPGNILVTSDNQTHILDFGVARATETDLQLTTLQTSAGQLIGTLPYMSPEQVLGRANDIDTRSDVYSLGVIVYEVLAGRLPYDLGNQTIIDAAKIITEQEPTPLSKFNRDCRGDLNTIVLKALEKNPDRRYQSAAALAEDIMRYLHDEPVVARPSTALYQFKKFAARNKALVSVFVVSILMLSVGAIGTTVGMLNAQRKTKQVLTINDFMSDILVAPDPALGNPNVKMVDVLREAAANAPVRFSDYPETEADVSYMLGMAFCRLTQDHDAIPLFRRAYEIRKLELGETDLQTRQAGTKLVFALLTRDSSAAIQLAEQLLRRTPPNELDGLIAMDLRRLIAAAQARYGKCDQAEQSLREILAAARLSAEPDQELFLQTKVSLASVLDLKAQLGTSESPEQDQEEAIKLLRESIAGFERLFGPGNSESLRATLNLVDVLRHAGDLDEAEKQCHYVIETAPKRFGADHEFCTRPRKDLAFMRFAQCRYTEAADYCKQVVEMTRRRTGHVGVGVIVQMTNALPMLEAAGQFADGEKYARVLLEKTGSQHGNSSKQTRLYLARFLSGQGETAEAEQLFEEILASGTLESDAVIDCFYCLFMGEHKLAAGKREEANELFKTALQRRKQLGEKSHPKVARIQDALDRASQLQID